MRILFYIIFLYLCCVHYLVHMQRNYKSASRESSFTSSELSDGQLSMEASFFNIMEIKDIEGYPNYFVTSEGDIYSKNYGLMKYAKKMKPFLHPKGYLLVDLRFKGTRKTMLLHRLIAEAFIPNPNNLPQINHKDRVKTHNWVSNLEWCTNQYNQIYEFRHGRRTGEGEQSPNHKLTQADVLKIRELSKSNSFTQTKLSTIFGVSITQIGYIIHYKSWKNI